MKAFYFIIVLIFIGCKKINRANSDLLNDEHEEFEQELINKYIFKEEKFIEYKDNIENELNGTEEELLRMYKINDSLLIELYKCQEKPDI